MEITPSPPNTKIQLRPYLKPITPKESFSLLYQGYTSQTIESYSPFIYYHSATKVIHFAYHNQEQELEAYTSLPTQAQNPYHHPRPCFFYNTQIPRYAIKTIVLCPNVNELLAFHQLYIHSLYETLLISPYPNQPLAAFQELYKAYPEVQYKHIYPTSSPLDKLTEISIHLALQPKPYHLKINQNTVLIHIDNYTYSVALSEINESFFRRIRKKTGPKLPNIKSNTPNNSFKTLLHG